MLALRDQFVSVRCIVIVWFGKRRRFGGVLQEEELQEEVGKYRVGVVGLNAGGTSL